MSEFAPLTLIAYLRIVCQSHGFAVVKVKKLRATRRMLSTPDLGTRRRERLG